MGKLLLALLQVAALTSSAQVNDFDHFLVNLRESLDSGTADLLDRFPAGLRTTRALDAVDVPWYSTTSREKDGVAREVLKITSVRRDPNFKYGLGVERWMSLSVGSTLYMVGLRQTGITVLTATFVAPDIGMGQTYSLNEIRLETQGTPLTGTLFKHWNAEIRALEAILVLAVDSPKGDLDWYRLGSNGLEVVTSWPVHKVIQDVKVFEVGDHYKLLVITKCSAMMQMPHCAANLEIFDFTFLSFDPKLSQSFPLDGISSSVEVGSVGDELYVAITLPEVSVVKLLHFQRPSENERISSGNTSRGWFEFWKEIQSPNVTHAIFFHVSYKMYLAIDGMKPTILRFVSPTQVEGCSEAFQNVGSVSGWMVLPVQTYREEVVVLAEVFNGYEKTLISLTWGGVGMFEAEYYSACRQGDVSDDWCSLKEVGLSGAVALQLGDASVVTVLMPQGPKPSALFRIYTLLQPVPNPLMHNIQMLDQAQTDLDMELQRQEDLMKKTEEILKHTLNTDGSNTVLVNWVIDEVYTTVHETTVYNIDAQGYPVSELQASLAALEGVTKSLLSSASDAAAWEEGTGTLVVSEPSVLLGGVDISGSTIIDTLSANQLNGESVSSILTDAVRFDQLSKIGGIKTLTAVKAMDIDFATVNEIPQDEILFDSPDKTIMVDGKLFLSEPLYVVGNIDVTSSGTVNNIDLSEEVFQPGKTFKGTPHIEHVVIEGDLAVDIVNTIDINPQNLRTIAMGYDENALNGSHYKRLEVEGNLLVERINGYVWEDLVKRMVWKDVPDQIEGLTIVQGVFRSDLMDIWKLNNLSFPDDYVLRSVEAQHVSGNKELLGKLLVGDVDVENAVDGVPLKSLVTLKTHQDLDGALKLNEADIFGDIQVDWGINGIPLDQIHTRSALIGQNQLVSSNIDFSDLVVEGHLVVSSTADGLNLKDFLDDLVFHHDEPGEFQVKTRKVLKAGLTVNGSGLSVTSGHLNGIQLSDIARVDQIQTFYGVNAVEHAKFRDLHLTGLWDDVDVVELNADTVRVDENQNCSAILTFPGSSQLDASQLIVLSNISMDVQDTRVQRNLCDEQSSSDLECVVNTVLNANQVQVSGELTVNGKVCGWKLLDFESRRLSRSRPQIVEGIVSFGTMFVDSHLQIDFINNVPISVFGTDVSLQPRFNSEQLLLRGDLAVDDLIVQGDITVTHGGVNGLNIAYVADKAVKLTGDNIYHQELIFDNLIDVDAMEASGLVNSQNLSFLIGDTVSRQHIDNVIIAGGKTFYGGFSVEGAIFTPKLTGHDTSKIITKSSPLILHGPLRVEGNVYAKNIKLNGLLNKYPVSNFQNRYKFIDGSHILTGDAHFLPGVQVGELYVMGGHINDVKVDDFFKSVVMKTDSTFIQGNKIFFNKVIFKDVVVKGTVNNIKLQEFANDVILSNTEGEVVIDGRLTFVKKLVANKGVSLSENLDAVELDGCLIKEWFDNAIYLDKVTSIGGVKKFSNISSQSNLQISALNAVDMSKVITLNQPQDIPADLNILFVGVQHNLEVHGRVNGFHLPSEVANTLMNKGNQRIIGQKTFLNGLTVNGNVVSDGSISGMNLSNAVTLDSVQTVKGPLSFQSIQLDGNLHVDGLVSDVDVQRWWNRAFLTKSTQPQQVSGKWGVQGQVRFMKDVGGEGLLDGEDVHNLAEEIEKSQRHVIRIQDEIKTDWTQLCLETNHLIQEARAQPFLYKQLEIVQELKSPISPSLRTSSMHAFEAAGEQFLVVSFAESCSGAVYHWNSRLTSWDLVDAHHQNIGAIERWISLQTGNTTYLVTSRTSEALNCAFNGGNVWRFGPGVQFRNIHSMEPWHGAEVDETLGYLYTLSAAGVSAWLVRDGRVSPVHTWPLDTAARSRFVPRHAIHGLGLSVSDGHSLRVLGDSVQSHANTFLPARDAGSVVAMQVSGGRKLVAVADNGSDVLVVYDDVVEGRTLGSVRARRAHSLSVLELGVGTAARQGQTLLAFVEDQRLLRVVEYKGVEGFVDVTEAKLPVSVLEVLPVRLHARGLVQPRHFLLLRSDWKVLLFELEMRGDPLDEPLLDCHL